jgi:hypothetical protein
MNKTISITFFVFIAFISYVSATPIIDYQAYLMDTSNKPITNNLEIVFRIHDAPTNGNELWQETHPSVPVNNGVLHVLLGETTPLSYTLFDNDCYYSMSISGGNEMSPRRQLTFVPLAIRSHISDGVATGGIHSHMLADQSVTLTKIADHAIDASKLTESAVIEALRPVDGDSSGLDADMLDGKHASDFALKGDTLQLNPDGSIVFSSYLRIKELKPNNFPSEMEYHTTIVGIASSVDFSSPSSLITDLILYWKMDEPQGMSKLFDSVSSLKNGDAQAGILTIEEGRLGRARQFDSSQHHYIIKPHDSDLDFGKSSFTVSFWMKAPQPLDWSVVLSKATTISDRQEEYGWYFGNTNIPTGTGLEFTINSGGIANRHVKKITAPNVFINEWRHVVGVKDQEDIYLYINGWKYEDENVVVDQPVSTDKPLLIGSVGDSYYYSGIVDEVAIWKRALSESEISELYNEENDESHYEGIPHLDGGLRVIRSDGTPYDILDIDNRAEVFRHVTGEFTTSVSSSEWSDCQGITGLVYVNLLKPVEWSLIITGHKTNTTAVADFRIQFRNLETKSLYYLPDKTKAARLSMNSTYSKYMTFNTQGANKLPKGTYEAQLQVKGDKSFTYSWNSNDGHIVLIMW